MPRPAYPSDLTNAQWVLLAPLLPPPKPGGRPRTADLQEILNAIFYLLRTGCAWRLLPHDLPPWGTVHYYFRQWRLDGTWMRIHETLRPQVREAAGRDPTPSAAIIDSQTVKTTEKGGPRGYDGGKQVTGRKRHIVVDTLGLLLMVVVHAANIQDRVGAKRVLANLWGRCPRLQVLWADSAYAGPLVAWVARMGGWLLEIVRRPQGSQGFVLLPHRWIVERTFAWLGRWRRLSKDYEALPATSEAFIYIAMMHLMLRRLAPP